MFDGPKKFLCSPIRFNEHPTYILYTYKTSKLYDQATQGKRYESNQGSGQARVGFLCDDFTGHGVDCGLTSLDHDSNTLCLLCCLLIIAHAVYVYV